MREIKFRVWDTENDEMIYGVGIDPNAIAYKADLSGESENFDYYPDGNIMQFTGLKDKNGKEIYEGDIVRCIKMLDYDVFSEPEDIEVKFENGGFTPMILRKMTPYRILPMYYSYEVVGNKYENKETK